MCNIICILFFVAFTVEKIDGIHVSIHGMGNIGCGVLFSVVQNMIDFWLKVNMFKGKNYTGSLAPADFSGVVFTCAHFQKLAQISSL